MEYVQIASKNLKRIMQEKSISVSQLAKLSGVSKTTIYAILKEKNKVIYLTTVYYLCKALQIKLSEFFSPDYIQ